MKKSYLLAIGAVALIGCGGDDDKKDAGNTDMHVAGDMNTEVGDGGVVSGANQTVSGFTVDIDKLAGYYAMNPNASAMDIIMNSCVPSTPVYALYEDGGQTETVQAGADCTYTLHAVKGKTIHMVAAENAATNVLNTYSNEATPVADSALQQIPAHVCTSNPYSAPVGVAATLGVEVTEVQSHGICMFGTNDHFTPPFVKLTPSQVTSVTPSGYTVYALTNPMTMPPTFTQQNTGPIGIYGIYNASNDVDSHISVQASATSGTNTYSALDCDVRPNFISFAPVNPSN